MSVENTILVTGYSYYSKYWFNPSGEVASTLNNLLIDNYRVVSRVFPVSFRIVTSELPMLLRELKPRVVLGLGLDPSARNIQVELVAVNYVFSDLVDVEGAQLKSLVISSEGPFTVYTTLPFREILIECGERRLLPVRPSLKTGLYLCNVVAYLIMKYGLEHNIPAGFLHIPPSTVNMLRGETDHGIPLNIILETVKCILEVAVKNNKISLNREVVRYF